VTSLNYVPESERAAPEGGFQQKCLSALIHDGFVFAPVPIIPPIFSFVVTRTFIALRCRRGQLTQLHNLLDDAVFGAHTMPSLAWFWRAILRYWQDTRSAPSHQRTRKSSGTALEHRHSVALRYPDIDRRTRVDAHKAVRRGAIEQFAQMSAALDRRLNTLRRTMGAGRVALVSANGKPMSIAAAINSANSM
jgi:hypothetical protein